MELTYSTIKALIENTDRESVEAFINGERDYNTTYAIMSEEDAREEVYNSYRGDEYMLGCFNASFLCDFIGLDYNDIEELQKLEQYNALGKLVIHDGQFEEMMDEYIRLDGFGHALNSYDGNYEEIGDLITFRQN